jgi:murein DD-endopeptidase MepM/ murein hydrolase activator NlpD
VQAASGRTQKSAVAGQSKGKTVNKPQLINRDYRHKAGRPGGIQRLRRYKGKTLLWGCCALLAGLAPIVLLTPNDASAFRSDNGTASNPSVAEAILSSPIALPNLTEPLAPTRSGGSIAADPLVPAPAETDNRSWNTISVKRGDTLIGLLSGLGITPQENQTLLALRGSSALPSKIFPGDAIAVLRDSDGGLQALRYTYETSAQILEIRRGSSGFQGETSELPVERKLSSASATIDSSLFSAGQAAGLSDGIIMALADVFAWDVDFALDIRKGDHFAVLYEELYRDGHKIKDGAILAAEFSNQGQTYRAIRHVGSNGREQYYSPDGLALRKAFLRSPVEFTRISSTFSSGRFHPVLNRIRAHKGVDYAAPIGTPIKSTGDGKVVFVGQKGGYGRTVVVQHGSRYSTLYAHLSRFARGVTAGTRIRQGQVLGYVGKTGLATGPHLHYEFRIDGTHRNPLTVALPHAEPLPVQEQSGFSTTTRTYLAELARRENTTLALNEPVSR